jgi:hypothetical protein
MLKNNGLSNNDESKRVGLTRYYDVSQDIKRGFELKNGSRKAYH